MVVDLAVEDDVMEAVGSAHRLRAGGAGIDDREAPMDEHHVAPRRAPDAMTVWAAVRKRGAERRRRIRFNRPVPAYQAGDTAHYIVAPGSHPRRELTLMPRSGFTWPSLRHGRRRSSSQESQEAGWDGDGVVCEDLVFELQRHFGQLAVNLSLGLDAPIRAAVGQAARQRDRLLQSHSR